LSAPTETIGGQSGSAWTGPLPSDQGANAAGPAAAHELGDLAQRGDPVRLHDRPDRRHDPPRHDLRVGTGLVHEAGDERPVAGHRVDDPVERAGEVTEDLRVGARGVVADLHAVEVDVLGHHAVEPVVLAAAGVEDRHDGPPRGHLVVVAAAWLRADVRDRLTPAAAGHGVAGDG